MHIKIQFFKSYCSSIYGSELWSLENYVFQDFCCSWRTAIRHLLNLPFNAHFFSLPILTGTLPVFDEICKHSSPFSYSCLQWRYNLVRSIALDSIVHGKYNLPLGWNLRFCCRRFGWQLEDFLLGFVSLNNDCFHNFYMNNIPVAQLQIASLVEELLSLRKGFLTFDCGNYFSKNYIIVLLNAVCRVMETNHFKWTILTLLCTLIFISSYQRLTPMCLGLNLFFMFMLAWWFTAFYGSLRLILFFIMYICILLAL